MFGNLKREAHVQPVAGCYSNQIHHKEMRQTLQHVSPVADDNTKDMLKQFWIYSCGVAREQPAAERETVKQQGDKLLAFTKSKALSRITASKEPVAA